MTEFEEMIREAGEGWLLDVFAPSDRAIDHLSTVLARADGEYQRRFGGDRTVLSEQVLVKAFRKNSHKIRAFLQALGETRTPAMLVMVWRILLGSTVSKIKMQYVLESEFELKITLVTPYGEQEEPYESNDINDAALLRHLGIMKMDGRPIFDGFYALSTKG